VISLRPYQQQAVERVRDSFRTGSKRPLLVLPTGGGKTVCFSHITNGAAAKGNRVLILVHRQELLNQCHNSLKGIGVESGLICAGLTQDPSQQVQVASVQTLVRRLDRVPRPDLIIIDEAHHASAGSWQTVLKHWPEARTLGVTATPCRLDGKGLGDTFDDLIIGPEVSELISGGFLAQPIYYAPKMVDLTGVKTIAGDYSRHDVAERLDKPTITGDAVAHYAKICPGVPAIAFCSSIKHATNVADGFNANGFRAAVLDGKLSDHERADRIKGLAEGRYHVLTSCDIISEGTDIPVVTAAILLRPTQSLGLHLQQIGRVLRVAPNKPNAIILDHVGNVIDRHGLAEEHRDWSLEGEKKGKRSKALAQGPKYTQCPTCYAVHSPAPQCPQCGAVKEVKERSPEQVDGTLEQLQIDHAALVALREQKRKQGQAQSMGDLIKLGKARGMKNPVGWAHYVFAARQKKRGIVA
jgi:DNA repair protein RadD